VLRCGPAGCDIGVRWFRREAACPGPAGLGLVDEGPAAVSSTERVEDLFRKEYAHLVSALTRVLGPSNIPLAEDVVHDALVSAMHAWRFGLPQDPKAWIIRAARNRAIDIIRREQRHRSFLPELATTTALTGTIEAALAPAAESASQLAMMFAVCDPGLNRETHVTLILRWLCGLAPGGIPCCDRCTCCSTRATTAATRRIRYVRSCARTRCAWPGCCWTPGRRRIRTCTPWPRCSASAPPAWRPAWTSMVCSSPSRTRTGAAGTGRASSGAWC